MQKKVKDFNDARTCHRTPLPVYARVMDIQSEMGELAKEVLKNSKYGTKDFVLSEDFKMEFGDVLYSLLSLANETGIRAEESLQMALDKYRKRMEEKGDFGSGR